MTFIFNLSRDVEDYLESFKEDKSVELEIGFLKDEGIDPWSLFGDNMDKICDECHTKKLLNDIRAELDRAAEFPTESDAKLGIKV